MVKPLPREKGAPISYYYYKPYKNEDDSRAANERAYNAANARIMLWHAQYTREKGAPPANYGSQRDVPQGLSAKQRAKQDKTNARGRRSGVKGSSTSSSRRSRITVNESSRKNTRELTKEKATTEAEETDALRQRKTLVSSIIEELKGDLERGSLGGIDFKGVDAVKEQTKKKGFLERNVGQKIGAAWNVAAESAVGDVTGRALNLLGRPGNAVTGGIVERSDKAPQIDMSEGKYADLINKLVAEGGKKGKAAEKLRAEQEAEIAKGGRRRTKGGVETTAGVSDYVNALNRGIQGKEHHSIMEITQPALQNKIPALRPADDDSLVDKILKNAPGVATGLGADIAVDPLSYAGGLGIANRVRQSRRALGAADELVTKADEVSTAVKVADEMKMAEKVTAKLPEPQLALGPGPKAGFELTDETKTAERVAELAKQATDADRVRDASEAGFRALRNQTAAAARKVSKIKQGKIRGGGAADTVDDAVLEHQHLLARLEAAQQFRSVAKATPVGKGMAAGLERKAERLTKLAAKHPENKDVAKRLKDVTARMEAARVSQIPENSAAILSFVEKLERGEEITKIGKKTEKAIADAPQSVQEQIVALMKENEAGKGKKIADGPDTPDVKVPETPSQKMIRAIIEGEDAKVVVKPSEAKLSEAAKTLLDEDPAVPLTVKQAALDVLNEAELFGRTLTKAEVKSKVAQAALRKAAEEGVVAAARGRATEKVKLLRSTNPLAATSERVGKILDESVMEEITPFIDDMTKVLEGGMEKRWAMTFRGRDLGEFRPTAAALRAAYMPFELVGKLGGKTLAGQKFAKMFRMGAHFPGETNFLRQMAENNGVASHMDFAKDIAQTFTRQLTHDDAIEIRRAIEGGYEISDPRLEGLRQLAMQKSKEIFDQQVAMGKYKPGQQGDSFVYHYYHSKDRASIKRFKDARRAEIKAGAKGPTIDTAKAQGLHPEDGIDRILLMQHRDFVRDLQRSNFRQGVVSNFGVLTDNRALAEGMGLVPITQKSLNKQFQDVAAARKATWYLPPDVHDTFRSMDELMTLGANRAADDYWTFYDKFVRGFKTSATIMMPSNWVNNTVGDIFLNYMDNVRNPLWYNRAAGLLRQAGHEAPKTVKLGGQSYDGKVVLDFFKRNAPSGGFIRTEGGRISRMGRRGKHTGGLHTIPGRLIRGTQNSYETREEWVRLAHFLSAMDDELMSLGRRVGGPTDKAFQVAGEKAAKRVAKWNIDYTAITPFERAIRARAIPFYTFMRKATPLMMEALATRPGKLVHYDKSKRAMEQLLGVPPSEDIDTVIPFWAQQAGITRLTDEAEPLALRDPTPLNVVNRLLGGDQRTDPLANVLNQINPALKMAYEIPQQKTIFNQRKIDDWGEYLMGQLPTAGAAARATGNPLSAQETAGGTTGLAERLSVLGIPITRLTENRQQAELHRQLDPVEDVFSQVNASIEPLGFRLTKGTSKTEGKYYILKDLETGDTIDRFRDFNEAVRTVARLAGEGARSPAQSP